MAAVEGIREILHKLSSKYILIIVSSATSGLIHDWLSKQEMVHHFEEILGMDVHLSKTKKIKSVFRKHSVGAGSCIFVTDTLGDIKEANKLGVQSLAVTYGFHDEETLLRGNPMGLIKHPQDIIIKIEEFFQRAGSLERKLS